jgi:ribosomal protein S18 acetylase RimI-like enzyme
LTRLLPPRPLLASDDRESVSCGRESLDAWFRRSAWRNQQTGASRTSVICADPGGAVAGFVSLSAGQIERAHLPRPHQRNQPDPIPVVLLGRLAVDVRFQSCGCARTLMAFALATSVRLSEQIGCVAVVTHPLDEAVRSFYHAFGFEDLPFDPRAAMAVRIADLIESGL